MNDHERNELRRQIWNHPSTIPGIAQIRDAEINKRRAAEKAIETQKLPQPRERNWLSKLPSSLFGREQPVAKRTPPETPKQRAARLKAEFASRFVTQKGPRS